MDWSPCSTGSLFISSTQKPLFSAKSCPPLATSVCAAAIFLRWLQLSVKVMPREKSYVLNCRLEVKNSQMKEGRDQMKNTSSGLAVAWNHEYSVVALGSSWIWKQISINNMKCKQQTHLFFSWIKCVKATQHTATALHEHETFIMDCELTFSYSKGGGKKETKTTFSHWVKRLCQRKLWSKVIFRG